MKAAILLIIALTMVASCNKDSNSNCDKWLVRYFQATSVGSTKTDNYFPFTRDTSICGSARDTIYKNKNIILNQVGFDLYNYVSFEAKY